MPDINLSQKTNLLEQDPYSYELQDVKKPALFHEMFPYNETPKIAFNYRRVPQNMPDDIFITDTTFRDVAYSVYDGADDSSVQTASQARRRQWHDPPDRIFCLFEKRP